MSLIEGEVEFNELLRVCNTNIPGKTRVPFAITKIRGIGRRFGIMVCKKAGIPLTKKAGELTEEEIAKINEVMADPMKFKIPIWYMNRRYERSTGKDFHVISNNLNAALRNDIERLKKIQCERGFRHDRGLKLRGQHTKTTGRKGKTLGVSKKREPQPKKKT